MTVTITDANPAHCETIARHMRQADRDEVAAASGQQPLAALLAGLEQSTACWTGLEDGEPMAIFGVGAASLLSAEGAPWMLAREGIERHGRHLVSLARPIVEEMLALHPRLANHADARNRTALRWLQRIGFAIEPPAPWGVAGLPFHRFSMERGDV